MPWTHLQRVSFCLPRTLQKRSLSPFDRWENGSSERLSGQVRCHFQVMSTSTCIHVGIFSFYNPDHQWSTTLYQGQTRAQAQPYLVQNAHVTVKSPFKYMQKKKKEGHTVDPWKTQVWTAWGTNTYNPVNVFSLWFLLTFSSSLK